MAALGGETDTMTTAHPLSWPVGWPRTESWARKRGSFGTTQAKYGTHGNTSWQARQRLIFTVGAPYVLRSFRRLPRMGEAECPAR